MSNMLPDRETAARMGWTHQVEWIERGCPCFIRCNSGQIADAKADALKRQKLSPVVIDLGEALRVH